MSLPAGEVSPRPGRILSGGRELDAPATGGRRAPVCETPPVIVHGAGVMSTLAKARGYVPGCCSSLHGQSSRTSWPASGMRTPAAANLLIGRDRRSHPLPVRSVADLLKCCSAMRNRRQR